MRAANERFVLRHVKRVNEEEEIDIVMESGKIIEITAAGDGRGARDWDGSGAYVSSGWD